MKKILFYLSVCTLLVAACSINEAETSPEIGPKEHLVTLNATVTKVAILDHQYTWQAGDKVAVFQDDGLLEPITFEAESSSSTSKLTALTDKTVGKYAVYPYDPANSSSFEWEESGGDDIMTIVLPERYSFQPDALNIPMLGVVSGSNVSFRAIGGVIRFTVNNIPATAQYFSFAATNKQIAGEFLLDASAPTPQLDLSNGATGKEVLIDFTPGTPSRVFSVPSPVGIIDGFTISLYDDSFNELYSVTSSANISIDRNEVITAPTMNVPNKEEITTIASYNKVSSISEGDFLIVYESGTNAYVFNGKDEQNGYISATIVDDKIAQSASLDAALVEVSAVTGGYAIKVKDGTNKDKYIRGKSKSSNGITFDASPVANSITYSAGVLTINYTSGTEDYGDLQFNAAADNLRFRYFYNKGQSPVALYKKTSTTLPKLNTPTALRVDSATKTITWHPVYHADSYTVTVGATSTTQSGTTYVFDGADEYYNVSVVAKRSDDSYLPSTAATLSGVKFGNPTLDTPSLSKGTVTTNSITVTWSNDDRATNGYYCSISDGGSYNDVQDGVTTGTVTFDGLSTDTNYTVTVYAKAVTSPLEYSQSGNGTKSITTATLTTINSILNGSDTDSKSLVGVTVLAVSTKGIVVGDETGYILAMQTTTTPADLKVGDIVDVSGTAGSQNSQRCLKTCTITKSAGTPISLGSPTSLNASGLTTLASSFSRQYVSIEGKVTTVNGSYYNIQLDNEESALIALYNPISTISSSIAVGQYVAVTGRTLYVTGNATKYAYIMTDSFSIHNLSASTTSKTWEYNESGSVNKIDVTVTSDNSSWTYDASSVSGWATVSREGNVLSIYPTVNNTGDSNNTGSIIIAHAANPSMQISINLVQKKQSVDGTVHTSTIYFNNGEGTAINGDDVNGDDSEGNTWNVTTVGTTSFTANSEYYQVGSSKKPATSITFTTTLASSATDISLTAKFGGFSGTAGTVTLKVGDTSIGSGSLNEGTDVTVNSSSTGSGTVLTVTVTGISKGVKVYWIKATYTN